jgi:SSS family solute:Na+ symporter
MITTPSFLLMGVFFAIVILILYITNRSSDSSLDEYAVGGRSYGPWYVAMSYTNSWWPGSTYIAFMGLAAGSGVFGFYGLAYSILGVTFMYLMASRAWRWGKKFDLRTQPDLMGLRFNSPNVKRIASVIGVVSLFPWLILGVQSFAILFRIGSHNTINITVCLLLGLVVIVVRQIWTIRMGMRGLIMTDMFQGIVAYGFAAVICAVMLFGWAGSPISWSELSTVGEQYLRVPGDGGTYGSMYLFSLIFTGVVGSLCWPTSFQRIYTASSVRSVKSGTVVTILISGVFYSLLMLVGVAATHLKSITSDPQDAWFTLMNDFGGSWMLGLAVTIVFAASMGWVDGAVQVCGLQVANDLINGGRVKRLSDKRVTSVAKLSMIGFMILAAVGGYFTFNFDRLQLLAQVSYQGIVQLAVPLFLGIFWKRGNKQGAIAGMVSGFVIALGLTAVYPDDIRAIASLTSGIVALAVNLVVYVVCAFVIPQSEEEKTRVSHLFDAAKRVARVSTVSTPAPLPEPVAVSTTGQPGTAAIGDAIA